MALLGAATLAMWWDVRPAVLQELEDWHSHEHLPERLGIPGFRRGSRWRSVAGEGMCMVYELESHAVLQSPAYLARLNAPTPWSTRMMPEHRNMVRSQCHVLESRGGMVASHCLSLRLSPQPGREAALRQALRTRIAEFALRPGLSGLHLLRHEAPAMAPTTEQKIRGGDGFADWVLLACGYTPDALQALAAGELATGSLEALGAQPGAQAGLYALSCSVTPGDVHDLA